ncbi:hypothetical protein BJ944DRAFT_27463 [Cunninghamella echinulata]|nr:hypothetical protein BJ944DRAFT_27463 [Cunninghamella echinulata]
MAPKRGGKEISSMDPTFIYYVFNYVMLGLFGLCYLYAIKPLVQKKEHALFLHNVVGLLTLGYLSIVLHGELEEPGNLYSYQFFNRVGFAFAWLFALEPSRRIMNLQSSNPNAEKISIFNIKQYLNSVLGCAILLCYVYVILYAIFNIVFVILAFTVYFYTYIPITQMNSYLELGSWPFFLIWIGLVWEHRSFLCHVRSLNFYGFLLFCGLIGRTVYVATLDTWHNPVGNIVLNFILYESLILLLRKQ